MLEDLVFARKKEIIRSFRGGIYQAFNNECVYCGAIAESLDHAKPKVKGGETIASNLLPSCIPCNRNKGSQELFDWYRKHDFWTAEREQAIANWLAGD
jgi:5-methylcytosine-specific restriction endonuclease McrA